jgi:hypothetical protein
MKPNSGSIFRNEKREKETQPNGKGQALVGGVEYWVSAWTNDGPKGKYQTLQFEPKDAQKAPARSAPSPDFDDVPPF